MRPLAPIPFIVLLLLAGCDGRSAGPALDAKSDPVYARIRASLDAIPAISNHDHLHPTGRMPYADPTEEGPAITLHSLWAGSYLTYNIDVPPWPADRSFATWWKAARSCFDSVRAAGFYRYYLPAFRDLYGVDFETLTDEGASALNARIVARHRDPGWVREVIVERANLEMVIVDPFWSRIAVRREDPFTVPLLHVHTVIHGSHPARDRGPESSPYDFAKSRGREVRTFDDYLAVVDLIFREAVDRGAVGIKSTQAYVRTLDFERVSRDRAEAAFGRPPDAITPAEQKAFEDFMVWHLAAQCAKWDLPFQIHTGRGKPDGSNPMLLFGLISGNPRTKFVVLHGGYPWIDDAAVLVQTHRNAWLDMSWLPTLSYTVAKRALREWLECIPANHILWGGDSVHPEGVYASTVRTRRCLADALAEKVLRGEVSEPQAIDIGRKILRDNARALYSRLPPVAAGPR